MTTPCLALAAFLAAAPSDTGRAALPFASLVELEAAAAAVERGGDADPFWTRVKAAFTGWRSAPEAQGRRLGESDIWTFRRDFLPDARLDY
jgi:hypothetical protein